MTQTRQNSLNIEWHDYDGDGWCPGCDECRRCGHAHEIGKGHYCGPERETVRLEWGDDGCMHAIRVPEMRDAVNSVFQSYAAEREWQNMSYSDYPASTISLRGEPLTVDVLRNAVAQTTRKAYESLAPYSMGSFTPPDYRTMTTPKEERDMRAYAQRWRAILGDVETRVKYRSPAVDDSPDKYIRLPWGPDLYAEVHSNMVQRLLNREVQEIKLELKEYLYPPALFKK